MFVRSSAPSRWCPAAFPLARRTESARIWRRGVTSTAPHFSVAPSGSFWTHPTPGYRSPLAERQIPTLCGGSALGSNEVRNGRRSSKRAACSSSGRSSSELGSPRVVGRKVSVERHHVRSRARLGGRSVVGHGRLDARPVRGRARRLCRFPHRPIRPRQHGAGCLEHDAGPPSRNHAQHGRTDRSPRGPRRSVSRPADSALGRLAVAARAGFRSGCGRLTRRPSGVLARAPAHGLRAGCGAARTRVPRIPMDCDLGRRFDPPGDLRGTAPALLRVVSRHESTRSLPRVRRPRPVDGGAHGALGGGTGNLVRVRTRASPRGRADRRRLRSVGPRRRSCRRTRVFWRVAASSTGFTTMWAVRPEGCYGRRSRILAQSCRPSSNPTISHTSYG